METLPNFLTTQKKQKKEEKQQKNKKRCWKYKKMPSLNAGHSGKADEVGTEARTGFSGSNPGFTGLNR